MAREKKNVERVRKYSWELQAQTGEENVLKDYGLVRKSNTASQGRNWKKRGGWERRTTAN